MTQIEIAVDTIRARYAALEDRNQDSICSTKVKHERTQRLVDKKNSDIIDWLGSPMDDMNEFYRRNQ